MQCLQSWKCAYHSEASRALFVTFPNMKYLFNFRQESAWCQRKSWGPDCWLHPRAFKESWNLFVPATAPWCICRYFQVWKAKRDLPMNRCCGHVLCITRKPEFRNLCLRHDVIEVANIMSWSSDTNSPDFSACILRNKLIQIFFLWQQGKMGPGSRVPVTSCVLLAISNKFPEPERDSYHGYHFANSDTE